MPWRAAALFAGWRRSSEALCDRSAAPARSRISVSRSLGGREAQIPEEVFEARAYLGEDDGSGGVGRGVGFRPLAVCAADLHVGRLARVGWIDVNGLLVGAAINGYW
jgi:hypothetical protein